MYQQETVDEGRLWHVQSFGYEGDERKRHTAAWKRNSSGSSDFAMPTRGLHDEAVFFPLLLCDRARVTLSHLSSQIFKDVADVPTLLRRSLVEW